MEEFILKDYLFEINENEQNDFIMKVKNWKEELAKIDLLPYDVSIFKVIENKKNLFKFFVVFSNDKIYQNWKTSLPSGIKEEFSKVIKKYSKQYYLAEIIDIK